MIAPSYDDLVAEASRELCLACTRDGVVVHRDARAARLLGVATGTRLAEQAAPGCESKLAELLERAREGVFDWEVPFVVAGAPITVCFSARVADDLVLLLGHVVPDALSRSLAQVNEMVAELVDLNRAVVAQKKELAARNGELAAKNAELADAHQGVLSLHAEIQERADADRQAAEIKARQLALLSHELRTPLNSILGLTRLLADENDGPLGPEQRKQIGFIRSSADELLILVSDVLELGRIEAGHGSVHIEQVSLTDFVASLRGALRPLVPPETQVELVIEEPTADAPLETDRSKVAQIVRNLVSNALKFTERGRIVVRTEVVDGALCVTCADTGIGVAARDQGRIFEEYAQIDGPLQRKAKGAGLGLPLSRRLAKLLGGSLEVTSEPGRGSTFTLVVPARHEEAREMDRLADRGRASPPGAPIVLVVEDDRKTLFVYERYLATAGFHVVPARTVADAEARFAERRPDAIVLDIMLEGDSSWAFLARLKESPETRDIPVMVVTVTNRADKARALGADEFWLKPIDQERLIRKLREITEADTPAKVLVIDDDETARYIVKRHLRDTPYEVLEASTSTEGVEVARDRQVDVILLDFLLEGCTAFDVIDDLKADPATRGIPVIVVTSQVLDAIEKERLLAEAEAVISKQNLSRELAMHRIRDALRKLRRPQPEGAA